jgi:hypothetical protein
VLIHPDTTDDVILQSWCITKVSKNGSSNCLAMITIMLPLLHPPEYTKDYILYLAASTSTIAMVLVQEDPNGEEHVIYYLSKSLSGPEL